MATATQQQPPPSGNREEAIVAAIAAALAAGATIAATRRAIRLALAPLKLNVVAVGAAIESARRIPRVYVPPRRRRLPRHPQIPQGTPIAARSTRGELLNYRAAYLVNAARRIDRVIAARPETESVEEARRRAVRRERHWFAAHRRMQDKRLAAARAVDIAAAIYGERIGWWSIPDNQPASEACQRAHGHDFLAGHPPLVGKHRAYPGAVHPHCACRPGPPFHSSLLP